MINSREQWTDAELDYLRQHYPDSQAKDLSAPLGRSVQSIHRKAMRIGLRKEDTYSADQEMAIRQAIDAGGTMMDALRMVEHLFPDVTFDALYGKIKRVCGQTS